MIGQSLAQFRITATLGKGGMGEVYRAEDTKLGREVAIKVLPDAFAQDPDRMGRFAREAQVLASLNHPNIAAIYQVEQVDTVHFLVMELVEGETLAERIQRGRLDAEEALKLALQITLALEEAHESGIIHRDLKPANVKITPRGDVKVLDFGLAKAMQEAPAGQDSPTMLANSPTLTGMNTNAGMILGTAAYMAPEQARGENVDRRADIWAFGVCLMEMLTGRSVYGANTVADTLAGVLAREPEWEELPALTPSSVRRLLERCLNKDVRNRLQAIGEARLKVERYLADPEAEEEQAAVATVETPRRQALPWVLATLLAVGLIGTLAVWFAGRGTGESAAGPRRANIVLPEDQHLFRGYGAGAVLSPDGTRLAYVLESDSGGDSRMIYMQSLDQWQGTQLHSGTSGNRPYQVFFSPDGNWLGFVTPKEMKKMPVAGGTPITLCPVNFNRGASWGADGTIIFTPNPSTGLHRIPDAGGEPEVLTTLDTDASETSHRWPQILPGGGAVLFTSHSTSSGFNEGTIEVLLLESGERKVLHQGATFGRYLESGHLVYVVDGTLFGVPFDLARLEVSGSAAPVIEEVGSSGGEGSAQYDVSRDGTLVYASGSGVSRELSAVWLDPQGTITPFWEDKQNYRHPSFSPDGRRLAVSVEHEDQWDIWIYDIERDVPTRFTFDEANEGSSVWSSDGTFLYFDSNRDGVRNIYRKAADGSGVAERITTNDHQQYSYSISSDGKTLAFGQQSPSTNWDLWTLTLDGSGEAQPFLESEHLEFAPTFSPDDRWIAYVSVESGQPEVYIRPRAGRGKWQLSSGGGLWPMWSADGSQVFFTWDNVIHTVPITVEGDALRAGRAEVVVEANFVQVGPYRPIALATDGRFVIFQGEMAAGAEGHEHVQIIYNWFEELNRTFSPR